jgi:glutamine synthetase
MTMPEWLAEVEGVSVCVPDHVGRLSGKRIAAHRLADVLAHGLAVPDFHLITDLELDAVAGLAAAGPATGFRNDMLIPLAHTLRRLPWDVASGIILADAYRGGGQRTLIDEAPRSVLIRQVERLRELGLDLLASTELEFYVFRLPYADAFRREYRDLPPYYHRRGDNDVLVTGYLEPFAGLVRDAVRKLGLPAETTQGEGGPGQLEINFPPCDPLAAADSHVLFKHAVKATAQAAEVAVTFMAKPLTHEPGNGCHLNLSLTDPHGASVMCPEGRGGLPEVARFFLAGLLEYTPELMLMHAPFGNSYRRFSTSGLAPRSVSWGEDNRTVMVRLAGSGASRRLELRVPGADCNPYLSLAAAIAAGIAGITGRRPLPPPITGDALGRDDLPGVPLDLTEAVAAFQCSSVAEEALGRPVCAHVAGHARHELVRLRTEVTDRELLRGFEAS